MNLCLVKEEHRIGGNVMFVFYICDYVRWQELHVCSHPHSEQDCRDSRNGSHLVPHPSAGGKLAVASCFEFF